jgi:hypothetical protein
MCASLSYPPTAPFPRLQSSALAETHAFPWPVWSLAKVNGRACRFGACRPHLTHVRRAGWGAWCRPVVAPVAKDVGGQSERDGGA